jgi:histidine triad (HIT) family protein
MPSLFTRIVNGEIPCHKILEDDNYLAFLDLRPIAPGHTLAIPKKESSYIFDMEDKELQGLITFAKKAAKKLQKAIPCKRIGVMVYGLEVPHTHIHLVPVQGTPGELSFVHAKPANPEELRLIAQKVNQA